MKDTNKNNIENNTQNNQGYVGMSDFLSDEPTSEYVDYDNFENVSDIYDDLSDQYNQLDKSVSRQNIKQNYLSKRKIKEILNSKYGITDEECVNELYSKAFNNKWKEIDVEHWLLNPSNIKNLLSKLKNDEIDNFNYNRNYQPQTKHKHRHYHNYKNKEKEIMPQKQEQPIPAIQTYVPNNVISSNTFNLKDELRYVLIEENYKKMQFDFQTEILKNHIDAKMNPIVNSIENFNKQENNKQRFSPNYNSSFSDEILYEKMNDFFVEKQKQIQNDMTFFKEKISKNEKVIFDTLSFIRKEMKDKETDTYINFKNELDSFKDDMKVSFKDYMDSYSERKNNENKIELLEIIREENTNNLNNLMSELYELNEKNSKELISILNDKNEESMKKVIDNSSLKGVDVALIESIKGDLNEKIKMISIDLNSVKNDSSLKNELENMKDLLENKINNLSNELQTSINDIYDELDETRSNHDELKRDLSKEVMNHLKTHNFNSQQQQSIQKENIKEVKEAQIEQKKSEINEIKEIPEINNIVEQENIQKNEQESSPKNDKSFYENFISDLNNNKSNKIVSNFDVSKGANELDIQKPVETNKNEKKDNIKEKLSRIDEIIKNSINELTDIKEYVGDEEIRIEDSIKLFEKVKAK